MSPRRLRPLELLTIALVVSVLLTMGLGPAAGPATTSTERPISSARVSASPAPASSGNYCASSNFAFSVQLTLHWPMTNGSWNSTQWTIGAAPISASFNITIYGLPINYTWRMSWGDGNNTTQVVDKISGSGGQTINATHLYTLPALYNVVLTTNYTCDNGPGANQTGRQNNYGFLTVYGSGGSTPITVSASVAAGPVPLNVTYTANISGAPANSKVVFTIPEGSYGTLTNSSGGSGVPTTASVTAEFQAPSTYGGLVQVIYPNGQLIYSQASLPQVTVNPLAVLNVGAPGFLTGTAPWNVTYWANATNLTGGGRYTGPGQVNWTFYDVTNSTPGGTFGAVGPTTGSPVWREYWLNASGNWYVSTNANLIRPDGVTIASAYRWLLLSNTSGSITSPTLNAWITPNNGTAPLTFNLTAQLSGINASAVYDFAATAYQNGVGYAWYSNATNLSANGYNAGVWVINLGTSGVLAAPGTYTVIVQAYQVVNGSGVWVAGANMTVWVRPGTTGGSASLGLAVSPNNGTAPLFFNLTAIPKVTNFSAPFLLRTTAILYGNGLAREVWWSNDSSVGLGGVTLAGRLNSSGSYILLGSLYANLSGTWTWIASANFTLNVTAAPLGPGPVLSFSASPISGSAPLNVSLSLVVTGGHSPFNLTVCTEGPFSSPNGTGPCTTVATYSGWNGSSLAQSVSLNRTGNFSIVATVTDAHGVNSSALAIVAVSPAGFVPALTVKASAVAPNAVTAEGATYGFVTSITGGMAPYNVQWAFGDGTSGSSLAGTTVLHEYRASGTFTATLTVVDALGHRQSASVGPLVVTLPIASGGSSPWWAAEPLILLAVLVGVVSALVIGFTGQRLARRREALNWLDGLEEHREPNGPPTGPK